MNQSQVYRPPRFEPSHLSPHHTAPGYHRALALGSLYHISNSHWLSVFHVAMYMFKCFSLKSSHPLIPPLCPKSVLSVCVAFAALQVGLTSLLSF